MAVIGTFKSFPNYSLRSSNGIQGMGDQDQIYLAKSLQIPEFLRCHGILYKKGINYDHFAGDAGDAYCRHQQPVGDSMESLISSLKPSRDSLTATESSKPAT